MRYKFWWRKSLTCLLLAAMIMGMLNVPAPAFAALTVPSGNTALINDDFNGVTTSQLTSTDTSAGGLGYKTTVTDANEWVGVSNYTNGAYVSGSNPYTDGTYTSGGKLSSDALIVYDASGTTGSGTKYGTGGGSVSASKVFPTSVSAGTLTVEEDVYFFGVNNDISRGRVPFIIYGGAKSTTNTTDILVDLELKTGKIQWKDSAGTYYPISSALSSNVWYHLKAVVNLTTFKVDYYATKTSDGSPLGSLLQQPLYNSTWGSSSTDYVVAKSITASVGGSTAESMAIDNLLVYKPNMVPDKPSGLNVVAGNTQVALSWSAASNASTYEILRSLSSDSGYASVVSGLTVPSTADSPYIDMNLTNNTTYYYKIRATNPYGSTDSDPVSAVPLGATALPQPPSGFTADIRDSAVKLAWNQSPNASTYTLKRYTSPGGIATVLSSSLPASQTSYYDTGLTDGTTYYYTLTSTNIAGVGPESAPVSITPSAPLASPANVQAVASNNQVAISWDSVTNATYYTVKRSAVSGVSYTTIANAVNGLSYTDKTAANGSTYYYVVSASNELNVSMNSAQVVGNPFSSVTGAPAVPNGLTVTPGENTVSLSWNAVSGASSYNVKRSTSFAGSYTTIANVAVANYTDNSAVNGTRYFYAISAVSASGEGGKSTPAIATPAHSIIVSKDGTGDFTTLQAAIDSIASTNTVRTVIYIRNGQYYEKVKVNKPYVSLVGESRDGTIVTYDDYSALVGTGGSYTLNVTAANVSAENMTIRNTAFPRSVAGPAVALFVAADKAIFRNIVATGFQDTLYVNSGRQYYSNVVIEGDADYIFGNATAFFDNSEIKFVGKGGGHTTAASTDQYSTYGYVFNNSRLTRGTSSMKNAVTINGWDSSWDIDNNITATNATVDLGRPWGPYANVKYINTWMDAQIKAVGWDNWGNTANESTANYGEFNTTGPGANANGRYKWTSQLTSAEANQYSVQNVLQGTDGWDPTLFGALPQKSKAPQLLTPSAGSFDKNPQNRADVSVSVQVPGDSVTGLANGGYLLVPGSDYTVNGNLYTISKAYMAPLPVGDATITFTFASGKSVPFVINIVNTTQAPSQTISDVPALTLYTLEGVEPFLPTIVPVNFTDQTTASRSVTWGAVNLPQYASVGSFTVQGLLTGTSTPVNAQIIVQSKDSVGTVTGGSDLQGYLTNLPFDMPAFPAYQFPDRDFNIKDYGAVGDGAMKNTAAFAAAIAAAANAGGGRVVVPAGVWLTGPIQLKSNINLHLENGAKILFSPDYSDYTPVGSKNQSMLSLTGLTNAAVTGNGVIDGNGQYWRYIKKSKMTTSQWNYLLSLGGVVSDDGSLWYPSQQAVDVLRPLMLDINNSNNVLIDGPTLTNSPQFASNVGSSQFVVIRNTTVNNDWWAQNGDGLDVTSSQYVVMYHNTVNAGDDGIGMKSSGDPSPTTVLSNVVIADNIVFRAHGGLSIGSNTSGGIKNLAVRNNQYIGTDSGINFKSYVSGGGAIENIYIDGIRMQNIVDYALYINDFYKGHDPDLDNAQLGDYRVPEFKNIHISNVTVDGVAQAVYIDALPNVPVHDLELTNVTVKAQKGWVSNYTANIQLNNVQIIPSSGAVFTLNYTSGFLLNNVLCPPGTGTFISLTGSASGIQLQNTDYSAAQVPFLFGTGISSSAITVVTKQPPAAPDSLQAVAGGTEVFLSWNAVSGAEYYKVKRSNASGTGYQTIASHATGTAYFDTGLQAGSYYYVVTAVNSDGESGLSNEAAVILTLPPAQLQVPKLTGASSVYEGQSFGMTYGFGSVPSAVSSAVYAQDVTFQYNPALIGFESAASAVPGVKVVSVSDDSAEGNVRILLASLGAGNGITKSGDILQLTWRAKGMDQPGETTTPIYLSKVVVADSNGSESVLSNAVASVRLLIDKSVLSGKIEAASALRAGGYTAQAWALLQKYLSFAISINSNTLATQAQVDAAAESLQTAIDLLQVTPSKAGLAAKIADATAEWMSVSVGERWGQFSQSVVDALKVSINHAVAVVNDPNADQAAVDQETADLDAAINRFIGQVNVNVSIGDLAIISAHYGITSASPDWSQVQRYDFNRDNKLDIVDLAAVARKILSNN